MMKIRVGEYVCMLVVYIYVCINIFIGGKNNKKECLVRINQSHIYIYTHIHIHTLT